jgi:hypothetical protein
VTSRAASPKLGPEQGEPRADLRALGQGTELTKAAPPLWRSLAGSSGRVKQNLLVFNALPSVLVGLLSLEYRVHALHHAFPPIYALLSTLSPQRKPQTSINGALVRLLRVLPMPQPPLSRENP